MLEIYHNLRLKRLNSFIDNMIIYNNNRIESYNSLYKIIQSLLIEQI